MENLVYIRFPSTKEQKIANVKSTANTINRQVRIKTFLWKELENRPELNPVTFCFLKIV